MTSNYQRSAGTITDEYYSVNSSFTVPNSSTSGWSSDTTAYMYARSNFYGNLYSGYTTFAGQRYNSVTYSICPKNWRMPLDSEWENIFSIYGATGSALVSSEVHLIYAGVCSSGSGNCPGVVGSQGYYWAVGYSVVAFSSKAYMHNYENRYGFSVRCIAR